MVTPHTCSLYKKTTMFSNDLSNRVINPSYQVTVTDIPCYFDPITDEQKILFDFTFDKQMYKVFMDLDYAPLEDQKIKSGDIIYWEDKLEAYNILSYIEFNILAHVEMIVERSPIEISRFELY